MKTPKWGAGSIQAIIYVSFQVLDEISHMLGFDNFEWGCAFCQWCHRYDAYEIAPLRWREEEKYD